MKFIRRIAARVRELVLHVYQPQCSCGFPASFLVTDADGRERWICGFGLLQMIDNESGRCSRWAK